MGWDNSVLWNFQFDLILKPVPFSSTPSSPVHIPKILQGSRQNYVPFHLATVLLVFLFSLRSTEKSQRSLANDTAKCFGIRLPHAVMAGVKEINGGAFSL